MTFFPRIILFGEAEKGEFFKYHPCHSLPQLLEKLGQPPPFSRGIYYAVQALLYDCELFFYRVKEEGYSYQDYFRGVKLLKEYTDTGILTPNAICAPGVGNKSILEVLQKTCDDQHSIFLMNEADFYDFLTESSYHH